MNRTLTSRLQVLLAKIAGRGPGIATMTPGVPINADEEQLINIAGRADSLEDRVKYLEDHTPEMVTLYATENKTYEAPTGYVYTTVDVTVPPDDIIKSSSVIIIPQDVLAVLTTTSNAEVN